MNEIIKKKLNTLPTEAGVYIFKNRNDEIIYVGKAKILKNRVRSYFVGKKNIKTEALVSNIQDLDYIIVKSEKEALILENNLIKKYKPHYNIRLKDDKTYPYLMITKEENPRLLLTRKYKKRSKDIYFGPYVDVKSANNLKRIIDKIYPLRKCNPVGKRACTYYQIGECIGPCVKKINTEEYKEQIHKIKSFLSGNTKTVISDLEKLRNIHINNLEFEAAAQIHEYIESVKISVEKQVISSNKNIDSDYIGYYHDENYICIQMFLSRFGSIIERKVEYFDLYADPKEILMSYLVQYYSTNTLPKEIYINEIDSELLSDLLEIKVMEAKDTNSKNILNILEKNAKYFLENQIKIEEEKITAERVIQEQIATMLGVNSIYNIDAFDNSNIMGRDPISVKVNFLNGKKNPHEYRKFKIKDTEGINDIANLKEALYRAYKDKESTTDLIVVDGGKNHVRAALEIIREKLNLNIKIIGLAKNDKHITEYIVTDDFELIYLEKDSKEYLFFKKIQDEVHRFAINYHRKLRTESMLSSPLDNIKGVGEKRKKLLLEHFSSIEEIKNADVSEFKKLAISEKIAMQIKKSL